MTKIKAELILASKNATTGDILYSFMLTYPRMILPEVSKHRCFSMNTSSTRAIPTSKTLAVVRDDPFIPVYIGSNQKGMMPGEELQGWRRTAAIMAIRTGRYYMMALTHLLTKLGVHKGIAGRYIEPWLWTRQIVSTTDMNNFILLRTHKAAEPHIQELARQMKSIVEGAKHTFENMEDAGLSKKTIDIPCQILAANQWHLPLILPEEDWLPLASKKLISAARCARTSYTVIGKETNWEDDLKLGQKLVKAVPAHSTPFEHQAMALTSSTRVGNFKGWLQQRKEFVGEDGGDN
jgi:hypothetical protein